MTVEESWEIIDSCENCSRYGNDCNGCEVDDDYDIIDWIVYETLLDN